MPHLLESSFFCPLYCAFPSVKLPESGFIAPSITGIYSSGYCSGFTPDSLSVLWLLTKDIT